MQEPHPEEKIGEIERELHVPAEVAKRAAEAVLQDDDVRLGEWLTNYTSAEETVVIEGDVNAPLIADALGPGDGTVTLVTDDEPAPTGDTPAAGPSGHPRPESEKPTVAPFYDVPGPAVDRAIQRYERRRAATDDPARPISLREYIWDEIAEDPVIYVDGEPLAEYAGEQVDGLSIEPDGDE